MISIDVVITRLKDQTTYNIQSAQSREPEPSLQDVNAPTTVYVGYGTLKSFNSAQALAFDTYDVHGENITQTIEIMSCCNVNIFPTVWESIRAALVGYTPNIDISINTALTYVQGGIISIAGQKMWWVDHYCINSPTI